MRILILGGTAWLGGEVVRTALAAGHEVTCLARGESGPMPDGVHAVLADRGEDDALEGVRRQDWDLAVDLAWHPGQVRRAVRDLADRCRHYVFVSSGNVYADHSTPGADETADLLPPLEADALRSIHDYGPAKVASERYVLQGFGEDRSMLVRSGLIGGPGDESDRSGYWPMRFAHPATPDGAVLVPETEGRTCQLIDVRDLASWLVIGGLTGTSGAYDAVGETWSLADHLAEARKVAGHTGPLVTASDAWLVEHDVAEWMGAKSLPLWLLDPQWLAFTNRSGAKARAAGLIARPLAHTLADVLAWEEAQDIDRQRGAGLSAATERALLDEFRGGTPLA